jgi:hypothetical protein
MTSTWSVESIGNSRYDTNIYHFWMVKLEVSHPLAATKNSGVLRSGEDATGHVTDYYGIL